MKELIIGGGESRFKGKRLLSVTSVYFNCILFNKIASIASK